MKTKDLETIGFYKKKTNLLQIYWEFICTTLAVKLKKKLLNIISPQHIAYIENRQVGLFWISFKHVNLEAHQAELLLQI